MKRKFLLIALSLFCILLCSCQQEQEQRPRPPKPLPEKTTSSEPNNGEMETGNIGGDYIYYMESLVLLKYHIPSGTATTVCQDPFCSHGLHTECPFAVTFSGYAAMGNLLYYTKEIDGQWRLRSYDGDSMQIQELRVSNGVIHHLFTYNYYLYFSESKRGGLTDTVIYRLDTQSGALDVIDCDYPYAAIYKIEAGRIVWEKGDEYFSTDLSGEDEREYSEMRQREWGNYVYKWDVAPGGGVAKLYRKNLSTGEEALIAQDVFRLYFYGDKIIYFKRLDEPRVVTTEAGKSIKDEWGGNVYVMNSDGSNKHRICHVEDFYYAGMSASRNNELVCGDWVGMLSQNYYVDEYGQVKFWVADMLVVNVVTGEYKFIKYNPYE